MLSQSFDAEAAALLSEVGSRGSGGSGGALDALLDVAASAWEGSARGASAFLEGSARPAAEGGYGDIDRLISCMLLGSWHGPSSEAGSGDAGSEVNGGGGDWEAASALLSGSMSGYTAAPGQSHGAVPRLRPAPPQPSEASLSHAFQWLRQLSPRSDATECVPLTGRSRPPTARGPGSAAAAADDSPGSAASSSDGTLASTVAYGEASAAGGSAPVRGAWRDVADALGGPAHFEGSYSVSDQEERMATSEMVVSFLDRLTDDSLIEEAAEDSVQRLMRGGPPPRLSDEEIRALARVRFEAAEQQQCSICLEAYQKGELLGALPCSHLFHVGCLTAWLQCATHCPLCRHECREG